MKRTIATIVISVFVSLTLFANNNVQKVYTVDSDVYKAMETLYILAGHGLPSSSGPWSESELQLMLSNIDRSSLKDGEKAWYDHVLSLITSNPRIQFEDNLAMDLGLDIALEAYVHTNSKDFTTHDDWFHGFKDRSQFGTFSFETWPVDNFYGYFELTAGNSIGFLVGEPDNPLYSRPFTINVPVLNHMLFTNKTANAYYNGSIFSDVEWIFPFNAFASAGGEHWNVMAGRTKLSWGNGETGNLMLSDSFPTHTFARFNTFFNSFKYSLLTSIYPSSDSFGDDQYTSMDGYKSLLVHRLEFNLFKDRLGIAVNESCMLWSDKDQNFSILHVNPFGFMHNEFIAGNSNSLVVVEVDYTPIKGINIYGQYAMDEATSAGEGRENPGASGILAGIKAAKATGNGILTGSLEFARTDPFLYLRGLHNNPSKTKGYGFDVLYRSYSNQMLYQNMFITYSLGNDVQLVDGKVNYQVPGRFSLGFETMLMQHGSMNVNSTWGQYKGDLSNAPDVSTPTTFNPFNNPDDYDPSTDKINSTKKAETSLTLSLTGDYQITENLKAKALADVLVVWNKNNVAGKNASDMQLTLGMEYSI